MTACLCVAGRDVEGPEMHPGGSVQWARACHHHRLSQRSGEMAGFSADRPALRGGIASVGDGWTPRARYQTFSAFRGEPTGFGLVAIVLLLILPNGIVMRYIQEVIGSKMPWDTSVVHPEPRISHPPYVWHLTRFMSQSRPALASLTIDAQARARKAVPDGPLGSCQPSCSCLLIYLRLQLSNHGPPSHTTTVSVVAVRRPPFPLGLTDTHSQEAGDYTTKNTIEKKKDTSQKTCSQAQLTLSGRNIASSRKCRASRLSYPPTAPSPMRTLHTAFLMFVRAE